MHFVVSPRRNKASRQTDRQTDRQDTRMNDCVWRGWRNAMVCSSTVDGSCRESSGVVELDKQHTCVYDVYIYVGQPCLPTCCPLLGVWRDIVCDCAGDSCDQCGARQVRGNPPEESEGMMRRNQRWTCCCCCCCCFCWSLETRVCILVHIHRSVAPLRVATRKYYSIYINDKRESTIYTYMYYVYMY